MPSASAQQRGRSVEEAAVSFARDLARTFGPVARFHVCRTDPPEIVGSSEPVRQPRDVAGLIGVVSDFAAGARFANRPVGRGVRVSVLPFPGRPAEDLALVVEVDSGPIARAARVLGALADPDGTGTEAATEHLGTVVDRLLDAAESDLGVRAPEMSRSQKQQVVKDLDDRGAFLIKKSVEQVAVRLGVSRFTIYNYLDQANQDGASGGAEGAGLRGGSPAEGSG